MHESTPTQAPTVPTTRTQQAGSGRVLLLWMFAIRLPHDSVSSLSLPSQGRSQAQTRGEPQSRLSPVPEKTKSASPPNRLLVCAGARQGKHAAARLHKPSAMAAPPQGQKGKKKKRSSITPDSTGVIHYSAVNSVTKQVEGRDLRYTAIYWFATSSGGDGSTTCNTTRPCYAEDTSSSSASKQGSTNNEITCYRQRSRHVVSVYRLKIFSMCDNNARGQSHVAFNKPFLLAPPPHASAKLGDTEFVSPEFQINPFPGRTMEDLAGVRPCPNWKA